MTTDQATPPKDMNRNPNGKGGFADNPQNRNPGGWKKEDTARYKLEKIMKMSDDEIAEYIGDKHTPVFEKRMATSVSNGQWREIEGMINQVYGKPQESVDVTSKGESINPYSELDAAELRKLAQGK